MTRRSLAALAASALVTALASAPAAVAAPPDVTPAAPHLRTPITVSWRATATGGYGVTLTVRATPGPGLACSYGASAPPRRVARGAVLRVTLKPQGEAAALSHKWCPGRARVTISRFPPDFKPATVIAKRPLTISRARNELPPGLSDTPASIRLLPGSTITLSSPAAPTPNRTAAIGGVLRGLIPSPFRLASDISITRMSGALTPVGLAAAPLCGKAVSVQTIPVAVATAMIVRASGDVALTLVLVGDSGQLSGCGPGTSPSGTTTVVLTGRPGAKGLLALPLAGATDGITLNLVVQVDLSGRP